MKDKELKDAIYSEDGCRIADAINTYNTALAVIKSKGFKVFLYPDSREAYLGDFWAIRDKQEFK